MMIIQRRRAISRLAKAAVFTGALAVALTGLQAMAQTSIKVGRTTGASGFHIPSYIAMDKGFFKNEGLDAEFVAMTGKALVTAGIGGAINFVPIPGGGSQASLKGAPIIYVVGQSLISQWAIVVDPKIKTVEELKGKTLGYGRAGSADYDEGEIVLGEFFKMNVGRDYKVISFQGEPERIAALINGSIQGGLVSFPHAAKAQVNGFKILLKTGDYLPRIGGTFWTTKGYLAKNKDTTVKFIRAIAKATEYLAANKAGSVPVIAKYFGLKPEEAGFVWDTVHTSYGPDIPNDLFRKVFEGRKARMESKGLWPKGKAMPDPEQFVARDMLTSTLRDMGYYMKAPPKVQGKMN
jgi:NitT/TauT family transport system substrate-binding protein